MRLGVSEPLVEAVDEAVREPASERDSVPVADGEREPVTERVSLTV